MIGIGDLLDRQSSIFDALRRRHADLVGYAYTIRSLRSLNVLYDQAYQRTFNGLYMVRRNGQWRAHFYELLETQKSEQNVSRLPKSPQRPRGASTGDPGDPLEFIHGPVRTVPVPVGLSLRGNAMQEEHVPDTHAANAVARAVDNAGRRSLLVDKDTLEGPGAGVTK